MIARRAQAVLGVAIAAWFASGCGGHEAQPRSHVATPPTSMRNDLVFVTRDGCVNTPDMRRNLDAALRALELPLDYQIVNLGTVPPADPRSGYPTPTVLYRNRDLFGMPEPTPPFPEPG
jgi:hypothetical protein